MAITVNKSGSTTDVVYDLASNESAGKKEFVCAASGLTEAERLTIIHNLRPNGAKGTDVHSFTFSKGDVDDVSGAFTLASVEVILRVPRATGITDTVVKDLTKQAQCLLNNTFVVALKNGITLEGDYSQSGAFVPN
jgi:hypothetical protein